MKHRRVITVLLTLLLLMGGNVAEAQIVKPGEVLKRQGTHRANSKIEEGIDEGFNKVEEGIGNLFKKKKGENEEESPSAPASEQVKEEEEGSGSVESANGQPEKQKLESTTQYDFVPGDKILYYEDSSQDAIGDFPALWTSNGSGEVKSVNIAPGKWLHMNGEDAVYCYTKEIAFPDNFIVEFDIIPDKEYNHGMILTLYEEDPEDPREINDDLYPGKSGLHITFKYDGWETKGYSNNPEGDWISGQASKNPVIREQVNHVIIWIQKRRVRIYHQGAKTVDVPTNIYAHTKFNRLLFFGWDRASWPMVTNLKITTASPDTRSKLITEGKLVTYGITFDVNKAEIKPESQGTLKDIATVLQENPGVRVKIVGHTDSDGDDQLNFQLSQQRAEAVKVALASQFGIDASRLETGGAGEKQPIAANDTPANKAINRRVEFIKK